ncbi:MAG: response regulator [Thermoplasmata archaeon]|nr:response regulator [Thermoplasmata archaeon]
MRILVAEDDRVSRALLERLLQGRGHDVASTVDGREALERYTKGDFEMVMSDWMMPVMDGIELCTEIRKLNAASGRHCYFIMVTAKTQREDMIHALELGVDDFISKPYDKDILMARVAVGERMVGEFLPMQSPLDDPMEALKEDHRALLSIASMLGTLQDELKNGIPLEVMEWCCSPALPLTLEIHLEKEACYMDRFLDRVIEEQGEWFTAISDSSFDQAQKEHEEMEALAKALPERFAMFRDNRKRMKAKIEEAAKMFEALPEASEDFEGLLRSFQALYSTYMSSVEEGVAVLKKDMRRCAELMRIHIAREETVLFPFAQKYIGEEDRKAVLKAFAGADVAAGREELVRQVEEIEAMMAALRGEGQKASA